VSVLTQRQYITTAIDYPNAPPHMGHVLEKVLADVCARWFRLRGDEVRFQIGTDEHGIKIQRKAEEEKITPRELVERNVPLFQELYAKLGISSDNFIRTSADAGHKATVQALWKKLQDAGMLEKRKYTGLYCAGCERFMTKKDLEDGKCPIHHTVPDEVTEENWFFLLSKDTENLRSLLTKKWGKEEYRIVPKFRENETIALLDQGLEDVSFSRPKTSLAWGIEVPGDEAHVMYVWCDALTNYISGIGYFTKNEQRQWWDDAKVTHVIGKDITRFHALIWPSMLKHAGVRIPDQLLVHGFLTSEGEKMSKSVGNVVVPQDVIDKYGVDALRFYLSHEVSVGNDGDFSWDRFGELYQAKLGNQLGNLLNRVLVMLAKEGGVLAPLPGREAKSDLLQTFMQLHKEKLTAYAAYMDTFEMHSALKEVIVFVEKCNFEFNFHKPWELDAEKKLQTLSHFAEGLRHVSLLLLPFMPETAQKISTQLGVPYASKMLDRDFVITEKMKEWGSQKDWKKVGDPSILFPKIEEK
jgi:methionyl-tRNA synthetase